MVKLTEWFGMDVKKHSKVIAMPSSSVDGERPLYEWSRINAENRSRLRSKDKVIETSDVDEANAIEKSGQYYIDRFSDSRGKYILFRRERR